MNSFWVFPILVIVVMLTPVFPPAPILLILFLIYRPDKKK